MDEDVSVGVVDAGGVVDIGGDADAADAEADAVASVRVDAELSGAEISTSPYMSVRCTGTIALLMHMIDDDDDDGGGGGRLRDGVINFDGLDSDSRLDARTRTMGSEDDRDVGVRGALVRE